MSQTSTSDVFPFPTSSNDVLDTAAHVGTRSKVERERETEEREREEDIGENDIERKGEREREKEREEISREEWEIVECLLNE